MFPRPVAQQSAIRPFHLRPATALAERVLLPGDPHIALAVAQALLDGPKMFNHARGLWGYTGLAPDGEPLTVQSTGLGGPSAAIVCEELIGLGARRLVSIGTAAAPDDETEPGTLVAAEWVIALDGAGAGLAGMHAQLNPDPVLLARLVEAGATPGTVASTDLFYDPPALDGSREAGRSGPLALDLQAAAILGVSARRGAAAACLAGVTGAAGANGAGGPEPQTLEDLGVRLGEVGYAALRIP
jgi:uridine phosphorylase